MTAPVTAVTRLDRLLRLARRDGAATLTLPNTDAQGLLDLIGELCEEHCTCECGTVYCFECGLGEPVDCVTGPFATHCFDCLATCADCQAEAAAEYGADVAQDVRTGGGL